MWNRSISQKYIKNKSDYNEKSFSKAIDFYSGSSLLSSIFQLLSPLNHTSEKKLRINCVK